MEPNSQAGRLADVDHRAMQALPSVVEVGPASAGAHDISAEALLATKLPEFDQFYDRHAAPIRQALVLTLGDPELAEDAVNEAMARALQRWKQVARFENPAGWVYRVAMNWALSWLRRRRRERDRPIALGPASADMVVVDDELARALTSLSVEHRSVVVCRFFLDWSVEQTAQSLKIPAGTVKSRLARALIHIRSHIETNDGGTP